MARHGRGGRHEGEPAPAPDPDHRPRGYRGRRGDRGDREPSFRYEEVRETADGREVPTHRRADTPAGRLAAVEAVAATAAASKPERRRRHKVARVATGLAFLGLVAAGVVTLATGNDDPTKVPTGPSMLEPNSGAPSNLTGNALQQQLHMDVQRSVNNGEHGKTVTVAPGVLTINTPDGQRVSYANPIVDLDGLPQQAAATVRTGRFDASTLNLLAGRVFVTGPAKDTPIQGQTGHNYDRGVIDVNLTGTDPQFTPATSGPHLTDVAVSWETPDSVAVGAQGPLEQNTHTGQIGQHPIDKNWQPMLVGAQLSTPQATHQS